MRCSALFRTPQNTKYHNKVFRTVQCSEPLRNTDWRNSLAGKVLGLRRPYQSARQELFARNIVYERIGVT